MTLGERSDIDNPSCPTHILDDAPSSIDELSQDGGTGPHLRIAQAIAELIRPASEDNSGNITQGSSDRGGKMIGIEGSWGTGKTTVVDLLRQQLEKDPLVEIFVFDAWAHRSDPLRRTFLESIVEFLRSTEREWITESIYNKEEKGWKHRLDALAKRRTTKKTTIVPGTTGLGRAYAISALLVPLGAALAGGSVSRGFNFAWGAPIKWDLLVGIILSFAPLLVVFGNIAKAKWRGEKPDWSVFTGEEKVKRETTETDMPDPTSIEFEGYFDILMKDVLGEAPDRRLAIVIDNLDRVDQNEALAIWSTLQTFLQFTGRQDRKWIDQLWVIIPYDSRGLKALWEQKAREVNETIEEDQKEEEGQNQQEDKDGASYLTSQVNTDVAESFIDKSFQIRFELSPPVHSNWREYLRKLIKKAVPYHESEAEEICRVYSYVKPMYNPTPRELKLFVNQIGMIHRQWVCGTFPLSHIAYYVLLKRWNYNVQRAVLKLPHLGIEDQLTKTPQPLHESIAGLSFNVKPALGMEIVLKNRISNAIIEEEPKALVNLADNYEQGFWEIVGDIFGNEISQTAPADFEKATRCCMSCAEIFEKRPKDAAKKIFSYLGDRAAETSTIWPLFNTDTGKSLGSLVNYLNDITLTEAVADSIRRTGTHPEEGEKDNTFVKEFLKGISAFISDVRRIGHEKAIEAPFPVPCTVQQWIEVAPELKAEREDFSRPALWSYLEPSVDPVETVNEIVSVASNSERTQELISKNAPLADIVEVTNESSMNLNWAPLINACEKRLSHGQNVNGNEAEELLRILFYFYKAGQETHLKKLVNQGHIYHCLSHKESQRHPGCKVRCLVAIMIIRPDLSEANKMPGNAKDGYNYMTSELLKSNDNQDASALLKVIFDETFPSVLFKSVNAQPLWDRLFVKVFQFLADDSSLCLELPTDLIIDKWPDIAQQINEDDPERFSRLIKTLAREGSLTDELCSKGFEVKFIRLYIATIKAIKSGSFVEWCVEGLKSVTKEDWNRAFCDENDLLYLIMALKKAGFSFQMPHAYRDALIEFAKDVMKNNKAQISDLIQSGGIDVFELLEEDSQKADFQTRCAVELIGQGEEVTPLFFNLFGDHMLEPSKFRGDRIDSSVSVLFQGFIVNQNVKGLSWLKQLLEKDTALISSASPNMASVFYNRVQESLKTDLTNEIREVLIKISSLLGLEIPEPKNDNKHSEAEEAGKSSEENENKDADGN